jgi:hypothetical protein
LTQFLSRETFAVLGGESPLSSFDGLPVGAGRPLAFVDYAAAVFLMRARIARAYTLRVEAEGVKRLSRCYFANCRKADFGPVVV